MLLRTIDSLSLSNIVMAILIILGIESNIISINSSNGISMKN